MYTLQQVCLWGGLHTGFVFWAMRYPFSYRAFSISTRIRYAHVISVILAVVIPLPGALIHLKGGYIIIGNPSLVCAGRNTDYTYYTFILPLSVLLAITTCLLVLIFWTLLKVVDMHQNNGSSLFLKGCPPPPPPPLQKATPPPPPPPPPPRGC